MRAAESPLRRPPDLCFARLVVVGLFALARFSFLGQPISATDERQPWRWIVIVDAGSSGCRAHVFRWRKRSTAMRGGSQAVDVDPAHNNLKVKPG